MRGSPLRQAVFIFIIFLLAGVPVYRLTRPAQANTAGNGMPIDHPTAAPDARPATFDVEAVFAPAPAEFQLRNLDQTVLAGSGPQARFTTHWTAVLPPEGADLVLQAKWPALANDTANPTPAAAKITVHSADGRLVEKSCWAAADGTLTEVFTLPGTAAPTVP